MFYPEDTSKELGNEQSEETQGAEEKSQDEKSSKFDPSKLTPEELQEKYKLMQADYTRKTQTLSEGRKSLEQKEEVLEKMRENYEQKLYDLTQPKGGESLVDVDSMTAEQRQAWDKLNKHFDKKIEEREKVYKSEIGQLKGYIGQMEWKQFTRENPEAGKYRSRMQEIQREKGGINCPLTLDELQTLAQKDDLKKLGAEEYKASVNTKKKVVTTKPGSPAGEVAEVEFNKGPKLTMAQKADNWAKALRVGKENADKLRGTL